MQKTGPVSAHDVAAYILAKKSPLTAMKLQKLVYYAQAWSLVWDERPIFREKIEAWASGPVVRELYDRHRGMFLIDTWPWGDAGKLDKDAGETVNAVMGFYGDRDAQWLSDLAHREVPWRMARAGIPDGKRGSAEIALASMEEYYSSLPEDDEK